MKNAKRYLAVVLSFALFLALPLAFTQVAAAASKGTKVTQPSRAIVTETEYNYDGSVAETETEVIAFAYDKKGLNTLTACQENGEIIDKSVYTYNKSGYRTTYTGYTGKDEPYEQTISTVKKGKTKAEANYSINGSKVDLQRYTTIAYKNGKKSKVTTASADGKYMKVATYKKGVLSKVVISDNNVADRQTVEEYDKYGNITSETTVYKDGVVEKTVYKNTYKKGNLVKVVSTTAYSNRTDVDTGLAVFTYKKGKLVKEVSAFTSYIWPNLTIGKTTVYTYTKGGLIKTITTADSYTEGTDTKLHESTTVAFQYQNVAVNKKCVKAVKEAMEYYSYKNVAEVTLDWAD